MTFSATLLLDLEFAIILGVMLSLVVFLRRASRPSLQSRLPDPNLARHRFVSDPDLPECPQFKIIRVNGPIFFGAVNYVAERLRVIARRNPRQKHLLMLARSINFVDVAGADLLARGGAAPAGDRGRLLPPPAQGRGARAARAGRIPRRDRPREHLRVQGRGDRDDLPPPRPEHLRRLPPPGVPRVSRGRARRGRRARRVRGGGRGACLSECPDPRRRDAVGRRRPAPNRFGVFPAPLGDRGRTVGRSGAVRPHRVRRRRPAAGARPPWPLGAAGAIRRPGSAPRPGRSCRRSPRPPIRAHPGGGPCSRRAARGTAPDGSTASSAPREAAWPRGSNPPRR